MSTDVRIRATPAVERWLGKLTELVGLGRDEREERAALLHRYCEERRTTPDGLIERWQDHPELTIRRRCPGLPVTDGLVLTVESFLIHNGVNVFGDIVCMPRTAEHLAEQGERFARRPGAPPAVGPARP